ncbi:type II toxin-antitoxin system VapC family toxin [Dechloromonas sp. ARDL1]|uniref:type II toxin-antitoxin system VapC family toxin n=1 Tax=Dechloromonas sp. ARDL1 TaxID=3322121 RepID=UPI003DA7A1B8
MENPVLSEPSPRCGVTVLSATLVDSCVLIDVLADDPAWADWSIDQLEKQGQRGPLVINPLILAEISPRYERADDLEAALAGLPLVREHLPWDAAFLAGQAFRVYRLGDGVKTSPMPDFYIGAHALVRGMSLLTRDVKRYRSYFPKLSIIGPEDA